MYRMSPTYYQLRRLHFRNTIKAWLRGIDKALLAFAGVLPIGILAVLAVFVLVQAEALRTLLRVEAPIEQRLAVIVAWQFVTFVLLRALREAVLMPKARTFFSSLPIRSSSELQSDFTFALQGYSLLWAPLGWVACFRSASALLTLALSASSLSQIVIEIALPELRSTMK